MKKILLFIFIIFVLINIIYTEKILKIPFKLYHTIHYFKENPDIISTTYMSQLVTEISIGTPFLKFNVSLDLNDNFYSCFLGSNLKNINFSSLYNKSNSSTYKCEKEKSSYPTEIFNSAEVFSDNINFMSNHTNIEKKFRFLLIENLQKNIYTPGLIGLALKNDNRQINENSFLYQLKKYDLINTEIFYFNFSERESGNLIIGENIFNNENYLKIKVGYISQISSKLLWSFNFDFIYYGNSQNLGKGDAVLGLRYGLTIGTSNYENIIYHFFSKENCYINSTNVGNADLKYYWCEKENSIEEKIQNLTFELKSVNYNFTFSGSDLFFEYNNKKYFKILFLFNPDQQYWYLGLDFLIKYKIRFDHERKLLYIPLKKDNKNNDNKIEENINNNNNSNTENIFKNWLFWIVIFLGIVVVGLIVFIIVYIKKYPKKKKVYELDEADDDDDNNNNKTEKLNENIIN